MAAKKRTKKQRERDLVIVASYYCQGLYQYQIAEKMGCSQPQICYDLKLLRKRWLESSITDFNTRKAEELAKIDNLEREAWLSWTASKGSSENETQELSGDSEVVKTTKHKRHPYPAGDPRFLQSVQWCIQKRCKILGLDAADKLMLTRQDLEAAGRKIGEVVLSFVPEELQELCRQQLESILAGVPVLDPETVH